MILLEQDEQQRPKLPSDPVHDAHVTNRPPDIDPESLRRPGSPRASPPDYDTSQAQYRLFPVFRTKRRWLRFVWYSVAIYFIVVGVVALPFFALRYRSHAWRPHPPLFDPLLPPHVSNPAQIDMASPSSLEVYSCNPWAEDGSLVSLATSGRASASFSFPLSEGVAMRASGDSNWTDIVSGRLVVDVNTDDSVTNATLLVEVGYSRRALLEALKVCYTEPNNISALTLDIPAGLETTDTLNLNLTLLIPKVNAPVHIDALSTHLPTFQQHFAELSPSVTFGNMAVEGCSAPMTFESIEAESLVVKNPEGPISGKFNVSDTLSLDTINAPIVADVYLVNVEKHHKPTRLSLETGNAPINASVVLEVEQKSFYISRPSFPHFAIKASTFNADVGISLAHVSKPARTALWLSSTQGSIDIAVDALWSGTHNLQAKNSQTSIVERPVHSGPWTSIYDDKDWVYQKDYEMTGRLMGWIGWGRRPSFDDRHSQGHVEASTSLGPVLLRVERPSETAATAVR